MPLSREALSKETFFPHPILCCGYAHIYCMIRPKMAAGKQNRNASVTFRLLHRSLSAVSVCQSVCHGVSTRFNGPRPRRHVHRSGQTPPLLVPTTGMFESHWEGGCDVSSAASLRRRATATWWWPTRKMAPVSSANSPLLTSTETFATLWSQWTRPAGKRTTDCS